MEGGERGRGRVQYLGRILMLARRLLFVCAKVAASFVGESLGLAVGVPQGVLLWAVFRPRRLMYFL